MLNVMIIMGRLVDEPKPTRTKNGTTLCNFCIANNENGISTFLDCTAYDKTAEALLNYKHKGDTITVVGTYRVDTWEDPKTGQRRKTPRCSVSRCEFMMGDGPKKQEPQQAEPEEPSDNDMPF